jgi:hypothetical protein
MGLDGEISGVSLPGRPETCDSCLITHCWASAWLTLWLNCRVMSDRPNNELERISVTFGMPAN